ncbi:hypothetical protein BpHYR1_040312 [Brachionus plicatilis]|uniref:Uncharacterized protein n=1 Tax=Brachionus plicatilis TaxID=10195 RepID=A0A3M7Q1E9_BRAPC|nr:hypothetical protein BpHYR1_040312 [Brachionus plicatilis]
MARQLNLRNRVVIENEIKKNPNSKNKTKIANELKNTDQSRMENRQQIMCRFTRKNEIIDHDDDLDFYIDPDFYLEFKCYWDGKILKNKKIKAVEYKDSEMTVLSIWYAKDEYQWPFIEFFCDEKIKNFQIEWKEYPFKEIGYTRKKKFKVPMPSNAEEICSQIYGENWTKIVVIAEGHSIRHLRKLSSSVDHTYNIESGELIRKVNEKKKYLK